MDTIDYENNYFTLKLELEQAFRMAAAAPGPREAKDILIEVQGKFREFRLRAEDREELYGRLQDEFTRVNTLISREREQFEQEARLHYLSLKEKVDQAIHLADATADKREAKQFLIEAQQAFTGIRLIREQREELYGKLQAAFDTLHHHLDEDRQRDMELAARNYEQFAGRVRQVRKEAGGDEPAYAESFKIIREKIRDLQSGLRDSHMLREQKDELYAILQEAFSLVNQRQDTEREQFETEAMANYRRLGSMVSAGLAQAQESTEFRETREFLKKIQGEFKGIRMVKEQREELYARLQTAFSILRERTDNYFREKQKNWEVKMEFRVKDLSVHILELQVSIEKEKERLEELENQLDILEQRPVESPARLMVKAQLQSVRDSIRRNEEEIATTQEEMESLMERLGMTDSPEEPTQD